MKKIAHLALVLAASLSMSAGAAEERKVQSANILCDLLGIMCPVIIATSTSDDEDGGGDGLEPPK